MAGPKKVLAKRSPYNNAEIDRFVVTISAKVGTTVTVTLQAKDANNNNPTVPVTFAGHISDAANGLTCPAAADTIAATTGLAIPLIAGKAFRFVTDATGALVLTFTNAGSNTSYLAMYLATSRMQVSAAITH